MSALRMIAPLAALSLAALCGCGPRFGYLDWAERTSPPLPVALGPTHVSIPEGIAVAASPIAMSTDGEVMEKVSIGLFTSNAGVLGVEDGEDKSFILFGVHPGQATISVYIDGDPVKTIPAVVTQQQP